jgi:MFS family permease
VTVWTWTPGILLLFTFLLLLFPDGHLPSRRWRPVAWLAALALVVMVVPVAVTAWPIRGVLLTEIGDTAPAAAPDSFKLAYNVQVAGVLLMFVLGIVSAASLLLRWRRSTGDERQQIKWFAFAAAIVVLAVILASPLVSIPEEFQVLALPLLPIASAIAIFKYRLYDVDVVISKTVVFTALAAFVTAVYLGVVVGVGPRSGRRGSRTSRCRSSRRRSSRWRSSRFASAPVAWRTAWSMGGARRPMRCSPTSLSASGMRTRPTTSSPGWRGSSVKAPARHGRRCGCT